MGKGTIAPGCVVKVRKTSDGREGQVLRELVERASGERTKWWDVQFIDSSGKETVEQFKSQQLFYVSQRSGSRQLAQDKARRPASKSKYTKNSGRSVAAQTIIDAIASVSPVKRHRRAKRPEVSKQSGNSQFISTSDEVEEIIHEEEEDSEGSLEIELKKRVTRPQPLLSDDDYSLFNSNDDYDEESDDDNARKLPAKPLKGGVGLIKGSRVKKRGSSLVGTIMAAVGSRRWLVEFDGDGLDEKRQVLGSKQLVHCKNDIGAVQESVPTRAILDVDPMSNNVEATLDDGSASRAVLAFNTSGTDIEAMLSSSDDEDDDDDDFLDDAERANAVQEEDIIEPRRDVNENDVSNEKAAFDYSAFQEVNEDKEFKKQWKSMTREQRAAARKKLQKDAVKTFTQSPLLEVFDNQTNEMYQWKYCMDDSIPSNPAREKEVIGIRGFDFQMCSDDETLSADVFFHLWPGDPYKQHDNLNHWAKIHNEKQKAQGKGTIKLFTQREHFKCIAIVLAATGYTQKGIQLWKNKIKFESFFEPPKFGESFNISFTRFDQWKKLFVYSFADKNVNKSDPWWRIRSIVDDYNQNRKENVAAGFMRVLDESMSAWCPQTTKTGGLPNISFIIRKPEPLGTEFKVMACPELKMFLGLELQEGKDPMRNKHPQSLGSTAACTHHLTDMTTCAKAQAESEQPGETVSPSIMSQGRKDEKDRCVILGDSWFGSYDCIVNLKRNLGHEAILVIKTGHRKTPKKALDQVMKHWPAGSYVVFSIIDEGVGDEKPVSLNYIAYKYNVHTVLHFIATEDAGSTKPDPDRPYFAKFPDEHGNVICRAIERPSIVSTYFENSNVIDTHNQKRQHSLALEKKWIVKSGEYAPWHRVATTLVGMNLVDTKEGLQYMVGSDHPLKSAKTKDFTGNVVSAILRMDLSDSVVPPKRNIPSLCPVGEVAIPSNCSPVSQITDPSGSLELVCGEVIGNPPDAPQIPAHFREMHPKSKIIAPKGAKSRGRGNCRAKGCSSQSAYKCESCNKRFCDPNTTRNGKRYCFYAHVAEEYIKSGSASPIWASAYEQWRETQEYLN